MALGLRPITTNIELLPDDADWESRETYWVKYYRSLGYDLVNSTDGGIGVKNAPPEVHTRISRTKKAMNLTGDRNPNFGKNHSQERKENIRRGKTGLNLTEAHRLAISIAVNDPECIERNRLSQKTRKRVITKDGTVYESLRFAAISLGVSQKTIARWLAAGKLKGI